MRPLRVIFVAGFLVGCGGPSQNPGPRDGSSVSMIDGGQLGNGHGGSLQNPCGAIAIPAGTVALGCLDPQCSDSEEPGSTAAVGAFTMDECETTLADYYACVSAGACTSPTHPLKDDDGNYDPSKHPSDPAAGINGQQAQQYCAWIGERLPTEAEWERAARGDGRADYPTGTTPPTCAVANMSWTCTAVPGSGGVGFHPVAVNAFPTDVSPFGVLGMTGNVTEWVSDSLRTGKGGSFGGTPSGTDSRISLRHAAPQTQEAPLDFGIRCVR